MEMLFDEGNQWRSKKVDRKRRGKASQTIGAGVSGFQFRPGQNGTAEN
jgi:hypothetical protein